MKPRMTLTRWILGRKYEIELELELDRDGDVYAVAVSSVYEIANVREIIGGHFMGYVDIETDYPIASRGVAFELYPEEIEAAKAHIAAAAVLESPLDTAGALKELLRPGGMLAPKPAREIMGGISPLAHLEPPAELTGNPKDTAPEDWRPS